MARKSYKVFNYLNMGIFPGTVMFICGYDYNFIIKHAKKNKITEWIPAIESKQGMFEGAAYFAGRADVTQKGKTKKFFFIYLKEQFTFTDWEYCALAHECLHICQFYIGDVLERDREIEAEAYLHTHLMKQCLDKLRGKK